MFYEKRKLINTVLIILALTGAFLIGKRVGANKVITVEASNKQGQQTQITVQNQNYDTPLQLTGKDFSLSYSVNNAVILDNKLDFYVSVDSNQNIQTIKVLAKDENNQDLEVTPVVSDDQSKFKYELPINDDLKQVKILTYALTKELANDPNVNLSTVAYQTTTISLDQVKKDMINALQN